jgi:hypothetical protein
MFFVRAAFWIFLILLLVPTSDREKADFYGAAGRTISDLGGFCTRNPDVCNQTTAIFDMVVRKIRNTVRIIEDAIRTDSSDDSTGYGAHERGNDPRARRGALNDAHMAPASDRQDTLRPEDRSPDWRGPDGI